MSDKQRFIRKYVIFIIMLLLITTATICFSIQYKIMNEPKQEVIEEINTSEINKQVAKDSKYGIKSFTETYSTNAIKIKQYYDINGTVTEDMDEVRELFNEEVKKDIEYIQIDGLKDKAVQSSINKKIKAKAYMLGENYEYVCTRVTANFANILSLYIDAWEEGQSEICALNIDLCTGNTISLDDVFVSSAPIKSYLVEGLYEQFGWNKAWEEEGGGVCDMDEMDASEYEDKAFKLVRDFDKNRENIQFSIFPDHVLMWNIINKNLTDEDYDQNLNISFINHKEEVAIYKRYLTNNNIYENNSLAINDIIVMTSVINEDYWKTITYGKIADNIFMEDVVFYFGDEDDDIEELNAYFKKISDETKEELISKYKNKGAFFQREYYLSKNEETGNYDVTEATYKAVCTRSYFENGAFEDYVKVKSLPQADVSLQAFSEYMQKDYPNFDITESHRMFYLNDKGEFLYEEKDDYSLDDEDVKIEVDKESVTPTSVSITIINNTEDEITYGEEFKIQKKVGNEWEDVEFLPDTVWIAIAYITKPKSETTKKIDFEYCCGELSNGIYRIRKKIYNFGTFNVYSDEFEIK